MNTRLAFILLTVIASLSLSASAEDYEQHVQHFASNTPPDTVRTALRALYQAGTNAFPMLLAHLQDKSPAEHTFFQREAIIIGSDGTVQLATPTIGDACFGVLQGQIEGNWPKGFRDYYVLSPDTVRDWLTRHGGLSLQQLRIEAAQESLRRAEADTPKKKDHDFHQQTLKFLRENLDEAKRNATS